MVCSIGAIVQHNISTIFIIYIIEETNLFATILTKLQTLREVNVYQTR